MRNNFKQEVTAIDRPWTKNLPTERKLIHGQWVEVTMCPPAGQIPLNDGRTHRSMASISQHGINHTLMPSSPGCYRAPMMIPKS